MNLTSNVIQRNRTCDSRMRSEHFRIHAEAHFRDKSHSKAKKAHDTNNTTQLLHGHPGYTK